MSRYYVGVTPNESPDPEELLAASQPNRPMDLFAKYKLPAELRPFIDTGLLQLLAENDAEKTLELHVPSLRSTDAQGRITTYSLVWIHPDYNAQFCHYYDQQPGDLPNFYVREDTTDVGDELMDLASVDDLVVWLESASVRAAS